MVTTTEGQPLVFDYNRVRAFLDCPETGLRCEILTIELVDGGRIDFPRDFSALADAQQVQEALPKFAAAWLAKAPQARGSVRVAIDIDPMSFF
jgi:hypothetical protein